jgi:hypothetical protein
MDAGYGSSRYVRDWRHDDAHETAHAAGGVVCQAGCVAGSAPAGRRRIGGANSQGIALG